jgi:hypothetical protein
MEVRGEADLEEEDAMQVDGARKVVYVLHPNCNVESLVGQSGEATQVVES